MTSTGGSGGEPWPSGGTLRITIAHRGNGTSRHIENYEELAEALRMTFQDAVVVTGRDGDLSRDAKVVITIIDTTNRSHISSFEDQVRLAANSHILIAEHGAFQTNLMFLRSKGLLIDLRGKICIVR